MALPLIYGEFGVVMDPSMTISEKGNAMLRLRGIAKDRVRDANGTWADGDPMFIDIVVLGKVGENLFESVGKGDTIMVSGKLRSREYEKDGAKQVAYQILAESAAVSVRWKPTRETGLENVATVKEALGAAEIPF